MSTKTANTKILLVDDGPDAPATMRRMLKRIGGVEALGCSSPARALRALALDPHRFELAVLDYNLPEMFGGDLASRTLGHHPTIPILCLTGYLPAGFHDTVFTKILRKPLRISELREAIHDCLSAESTNASYALCQ